jgi:hypothetical protein
LLERRDGKKPKRHARSPTPGYKSMPVSNNQLEESVSTQFGTQIDSNNEQRENAQDSIRESCERASKVISRRNLHEEKQSQQRT